MFENHRKSLIQHFERATFLHFEWKKCEKKWWKTSKFKNSSETFWEFFKQCAAAKVSYWNIEGIFLVFVLLTGVWSTEGFFRRSPTFLISRKIQFMYHGVFFFCRELQLLGIEFAAEARPGPILVGLFLTRYGFSGHLLFDFLVGLVGSACPSHLGHGNLAQLLCPCSLEDCPS